MTTFDYILILLAAGVLIYQLQLLVRMKRDVLIPGVPPNRKAVGVLMLLVIALAVLRTEDFTRQWPLFVLVVVVCITVFLGGAGLAGDGMYSSGTFISFKQAAYYEFGQTRDGKPVFRLSRLTKEGHMIIRSEQVAEITQMMEDHSIPTFDEYQKKMSKRLDARVAASNKKKKKK